MGKYRKLTISVCNDELNAIEDYCVRHFQHKKKKLEARKKTLRVWGRLVKEWDKA